MNQLSTTNANETKSYGSKIKSALSKPNWRVALLLGLVSFGMGATLSLVRWPVPFVHDEFSYLLAADTFCEGRLTNPTHPFWQHFESFHIIHEPSYSSKYPPGQGAFLALGQFVTGHAIAGIWLLSALATAACYWMLLGWLPARWATVGGLLFLLHPGYQIGWGQSYWGGTLAFLGGALVCGAAVRLVKRIEISAAIAMGTGTLMLAASRPYEGAVFCLLCGAMVLVGWARIGWPNGKSLLLRTVIPMASLLIVGGLAMATYNKSVTGSSTTMPYQVHEEAYTVAPLFLWQEVAEKRGYRHEMIARHHYGWMMMTYKLHDTLPSLLRIKASMTEHVFNFFLPLPLACCFLFLMPNFLQRQRDSNKRFWHLVILAVVFFSWLATMLTSVLVFPHYMAPMAPLLLLLTVWGLRNAPLLCRHYLSNGKVQWLVIAFLAFQTFSFGQQALAYATASKDFWPWQRAQIMSQLEATADEHLVFVRYDKSHNSCFEWVYNRADIDQSKVAWAREMNSEDDQALVEYFSGRQVWLLEADKPNPTLQPWSATDPPASNQQGSE